MPATGGSAVPGDSGAAEPERATLSPRQQAILAFVRSYIHTYDYPPTMREIGADIDACTSIVNYNLDVLARAGLIERDRESKARGLRLVGEPAPGCGAPCCRAKP